MKTIYTILLGLISICLLTTCDKPTYYYIDKSDWFSFKENDTLVYNGINRIDTFMIRQIETNFRTSDKTRNYEQLHVVITELTKNCKNTLYDYCYGMSFRREYDRTQIQWRNSGYDLTDNSGIKPTTYILGSINIGNVYIIQYNNPRNEPDKDIKTIYYTHKYGIIAYETLNGEKFELANKYLIH